MFCYQINYAINLNLIIVGNGASNWCIYIYDNLIKPLFSLKSALSLYGYCSYSNILYVIFEVVRC